MARVWVSHRLLTQHTQIRGYLFAIMLITMQSYLQTAGGKIEYKGHGIAIESKRDFWGQYKRIAVHTERGVGEGVRICQWNDAIERAPL